MLFWAVFTLGYFFGVFFTLAVFLKKERAEELQSVDLTENLGQFEDLGPWEIFTQITRPNYPKTFLAEKQKENKVLASPSIN